MSRFMEIERKFLIQKMPEHPEQYKSHLIEQAYLNVRPVGQSTP